MAPKIGPSLPPPGVTYAQLLRLCGRQPKPEEKLGFSVGALRFRYGYNQNPAANAYKTDKTFPGKDCCSSFSTAGYGPLASHARRLPPLFVDNDASPADVRLEYDRFERREWSRAAVSRPFTGPPARVDEWAKKAWVPAPDTYSPEKCRLLQLKTPPVRFQFESRTLRDGDLPRLLRAARDPAPNHYTLPPARPDRLTHGAESDFRPGVRRITWLDDSLRRGRTTPAPNQYSRCHSESSLLGGGRSIDPERPAASVPVTPGPGQYETGGHGTGWLPTFNARPPAFLSTGSQIGEWTSPRGRPPCPSAYDVPRLYGNAEMVFNWRQRLKWI